MKINLKQFRLAEALKSGFFKGVGIGAGLITTSVFAAAAAMNVFTPGQVVSADLINQNFRIAAPEGAIMAFYLDDCPEGWAPADGTNGTPDLQGRFIRGRDLVNGTTRDPAGLRGIGDFQGDAFQGHRHSISAGNINSGGSINWVGTNGSFTLVTPGVGDPISDGFNGAPRTANETRPENIALTYCMRKN